MKKITFIAAFCCFSPFAFSQYNTSNTNWNTGSNSVAAGYIGLGVKTTSAATTPLATFNFQVHGVVDYIVPLVGETPADPSGMTTKDPNVSATASGTEKSTVNYGKTARIGLTNLSTGKTEFDGTVLRMSEYDFVLRNQETAGNVDFATNNLLMRLSGSTNRIWVGTTGTTASNFAKFNLRASDNGLFVETIGLNKYGVSIKMGGATDRALQVFANDGTTRNFSVLGNGQVFARRYTTTLANIPDYVFEPAYKLMSLADLRSFVSDNKHLPNVPSAKEYEAEGVDLGEMNRVLLEKTEELTLYILQLEERLQKLEARLPTNAKKK